MLGTEKRVRATHGEGVDDETLAKHRNSGSLAFVAFVIAVGALLLGVAQYTDLAGNSATSANSAAIAEARNQLSSLQGRLDALEQANKDERAMLVDSIVSDMGAKAAFLAGQGLSPEQMDTLRKALAPVLPQPAATGPATSPDTTGSDTTGAATDQQAKPALEPIAPETLPQVNPIAPEPATTATPAVKAAPAPETAPAPAPAPTPDMPATDKPADATAQ